MDIRVLQYFLAVAEAESITKAAEQLHMTQPPLSRQLRDLEEELGTPLFVRGNRKITLTEDGLLLRKRAEELVALMEKTKAELRSDRGTVRGDVYIAGGESHAIATFARAAKTLQAQHPAVHYHLISGDAELVLDNLDKGLVDFGLLVGPVPIDKYEALPLPEKDSWGVLLPTPHPLAARPALTREDLRDQPLILSRQVMQRGDLREWFGCSLRSLDVVMTYTLINNAVHFAREGFGVVITLDRLVDTSGDTSLCFRPLSPVLEAPLALVWKRNQIFSRAAQLFLDTLKTLWAQSAALPPNQT